MRSTHQSIPVTLPISYSSANNTEYPGGWSVAGTQPCESGGKGSSEVTRRRLSSRDLRNSTTSTVPLLPAGMISPLPDTMAAAVSMYPFVRLITGGTEHSQNDSRTRTKRAEPIALANGRFLMLRHIGAGKHDTTHLLRVIGSTATTPLIPTP